MNLFGLKTKTFETRLEERIEAVVREIVGRALSNTETLLSKLRKSFDLESQIVKLREELETAKIEKARRDEEFARREREIEHKVGLERARQEFETEQARREAIVEVKEKNLKKDRERFEEQMKFHKEAMAEEVKGLRDMVGQLLKALPSAEILASIGKGE